MDCEKCPYCIWHYTKNPFEETYPIGCKLNGECPEEIKDRKFEKN